MKRKHIAVLIVAVLLVLAGIGGWAVWKRWQADAPKRQALAFAGSFTAALTSGDDARVRDSVVMPTVYRSRTEQEQTDFLNKALRDEISAEGLKVLYETGRFGSLLAIFPDKANGWAETLGINPENCVAFRGEKGDITAELVLEKTADGYRIVRCNNIKQLAL